MAISTRFDPIFRKHAGAIPVAYLRALAYKESGMNPNAGAGQVRARGLLQIVGVARDGYNQRHGTNWTPDDMLDPERNVTVATDLLRRIIQSYDKHPSPNLQVDWQNPEFVRLLTAGWNAGYSNTGGLGKVATYLEQRSQPVTHANVVANAASAGAVSYLADAVRAKWHRSVADLYFAQPDRPTGGASWAWAALLALGAWGAYRALS